MSKLRNSGQLKIDLGWFIIIELILCVLIIWNTFAEKNGQVSMLFACSLLVLLGLFLIRLPRKADLLFVLLILIIGISFLNVMLSWRKTEGSLSFDGLKNYFLFCATIIYIYLALKINIGELFVRNIIWLGVLIAAIFPLGYIWFDFQRMPYFTMNFSNPNLTGMYLLQGVLYALIGAVYFKHIVCKAMCIMLAGVNIVLLYWTDARNGLLSLMLFAVLSVWYMAKKKNRLPRYMLAGIAVYPLVFLVMYLLLINLDIIQTTFDFLVEEGKPLTSRVDIWENILNGLKGDYLTGNYFSFGGNAHNSHMVMLASFGIGVLVLTTYYLYVALKEVNAVCCTKKQLMCVLVFCCSLFMGMGEGALFSGGLGLYIMCCTPLMIVKNIGNNIEVH